MRAPHNSKPRVSRATRAEARVVLVGLFGGPPVLKQLLLKLGEPQMTPIISLRTSHKVKTFSMGLTASAATRHSNIHDFLNVYFSLSLSLAELPTFRMAFSPGLQGQNSNLEPFGQVRSFPNLSMGRRHGLEVELRSRELLLEQDRPTNPNALYIRKISRRLLLSTLINDKNHRLLATI